MDRISILGARPSSEALLDALTAAGEALGKTVCYAYLDRYHFTVGGGWSVALSSDSAGRIRVETCHYGRPESTLWTLATDYGRIARLVLRLETEIREPV